MIAEWMSQLTPENAYPVISAFVILVTSFSLIHWIGKNQRRIEHIEQALGLDSLGSPARVDPETSADNADHGKAHSHNGGLFRQKPEG